MPSLDVILPLFLGPEGDVQVDATWPVGVPPGTHLWLQGWSQIGQPWQPWSATNSVQVTQPGD